MKKIFIALLAVAAMTACQKDIVTWKKEKKNEVATGVPTVDKITPINDVGTILSEVAMGQLIAIYGNNFAGLKELKFNDLSVDLKSVYVTNTTIYAPVPRVLPEVVSNTMTVVGAKGTVVYDITVGIPVLKVDGLFNEFVAAGSTARIAGDYFDIYELVSDAQISVNGVPVEVTASTATSLSFIIPEGTPEGAVIELFGGRMEVPVQIKWREQGYAIMVFGDVTVRPDGTDDGVWPQAQVWITDGTNDGDPAPLIEGRKFARYKKDIAAWSWETPYAGGFDGTYDPDWIANPQDYVLKIEIMTKSDKPISVGNFVFDTTAQTQWNPVTGGVAVNTYGEWKTFTLPMSIPFAAGVKNDWCNFGMIYQPTAAISCDFSLCNARIVHK